MGNDKFDIQEYVESIVDAKVEELKKDQMFKGQKGDKGVDGKDSVDMEELAEIITDSVREGVTQALEEQQKAFFEKMRGSGSGGFGFGTL